MLTAGEVIHLRVGVNPQPKMKFAVCVDYADGLYLFINTRPNRREGASVPIYKTELSTLSYDSHVDLGLMCFDPEDVADALANDPDAGSRGEIADSAKTRISTAAAVLRTLSPQQKRSIAQAFD